jgi:hypothetical protein
LKENGFRIQGIRTDASTYIYFVAHYLQTIRGRHGVGTPSLNMPRWKESLIYGIDFALRVAAAPLLISASVMKTGPVMEVYATV